MQDWTWLAVRSKDPCPSLEWWRVPRFPLWGPPSGCWQCSDSFSSLTRQSQSSEGLTDFCFSLLLIYLLASSFLFPLLLPWPWHSYIPQPPGPAHPGFSSCSVSRTCHGLSLLWVFNSHGPCSRTVALASSPWVASVIVQFYSYLLCLLQSSCCLHWHEEEHVRVWGDLGPYQVLGKDMHLWMAQRTVPPWGTWKSRPNAWVSLLWCASVLSIHKYKWL